MFVATTHNEAIALLLVSLCCWGSWGVTAKLSRLPNHLWYVLFCLSICCWSAIAGPLLGSDWYPQDEKHRDFAHNLRSASAESIFYAVAGGSMLSLANSILAYMIGFIGYSCPYSIYKSPVAQPNLHHTTRHLPTCVHAGSLLPTRS